MNEIKLYGKIGVDVTDADFIAQLSPLSGDLKVNINSPGGSVFQGYAMYNALKEYDRGYITVHIDGVAASMASVICLAGDKIIMAKNAMYMIHNPSTNAGYGQSKDLRKQADLLDKIQSILIEAYIAKTNIDKSELEEMLNEETWLTADEALNLGFVDKLKNEYLKVNPSNLDMNAVAMYECYYNEKPQKPMNKELLKLLNLKEDATDEDVMEAIKKLMPKEETPEKKDIDNVIKSGLKERRFNADLVPHLTGLLESDFNGTKELIAKMRSTPKLSGNLNPKRRDNSKKGKDRSQWTLDDYRKNDPQALRADRKLYNDLYEAELTEEI